MSDDFGRRADPQPPEDRPPGAVAARRRAGVPFWLLPLLALLAAAVILAIVLATRHSDNGSTAVVSPSPATQNPATAAPSSAAAAPGSVAAGAGGQLTSTGQTLYPASVAVQPTAGQPANGTSMNVVELAGTPAAGSTAPDDERFFVGDPAKEVLVFLHIDAEPSFEVTPGQRYTFSGIVRPFSAGAVTGLTDAAAAKAQATGYYVEITDPAQIHAG